MKKLLIVIVLLGLTAWSWIGFARSRNVEGAELVQITGDANLREVDAFVHEAIAAYRQKGEKELRKYWIYPAYEPEFEESAAVLDKLGDKFETKKIVHPKFNPNSMLVEVNSQGKEFRVQLERFKSEYYLQSVAQVKR